MAGDVEQQAAGVGDHIPTVPAREAPQVDAKAGQAEYGEGEEPTDPGAGRAAHQRLHQVERDQAQEGAGPGKGDEQDQVIPERNVALRSQVQHVGEDVGRVGEEEQPEDQAG